MWLANEIRVLLKPRFDTSRSQNMTPSLKPNIDTLAIFLIIVILLSSMQVYPFGDLPPGTVLLYRETSSDPFYCQVPGCGRVLKHSNGAKKHGAAHRRDRGLDPCTGVKLHTGIRPATRELYELHHRKRRAIFQRERRNARKLSKDDMLHGVRSVRGHASRSELHTA